MERMPAGSVCAIVCVGGGWVLEDMVAGGEDRRGQVEFLTRRAEDSDYSDAGHGSTPNFGFCRESAAADVT